MSTLQLASDTTNRVIVEWNKYAPHFRVITDDSRSRAYGTEEAAMRAAKRLCKKLGLTLKQAYGSKPYKRMAQEFPDYDQDTLPLIPAAWDDSSWHNDACPSFVIEDIGVQVFIDYANAVQRETLGGYRYSVLDVADIQTLEMLSTEDWQAVLACVQGVRDAR